MNTNTNQPISPRRRLQQLLAIPDNQRSEAQWDEIVELEITLAPGNREDSGNRDQIREPSREQRQVHGQPAKPRPNKPSGDSQGKRTFRKPHKKPPPKEPTPT